MILELLILLITVTVVFVWVNHKCVERYYASKNVKYLPEWPLFGNCLQSTLLKVHTFHDIHRIYNTFPNERYVGFVENTQKQIIIRDPELIKLITVKDFDHFTDHRVFFSKHVEPLFGSSLFGMKGEQWRTTRAILSPAFTGCKMKHMMEFMVDVTKNTLEYLSEHKNEDIDVDDLIRRYTNDVIASTSFGLDVNSFTDRDNEFFRTGQTVLKFNFKQFVIIYLDRMIPSVIKWLGLRLYPEKTYSFFIDTIMKTVEYRKSHNISRPDMLQLMMETPMEWTPLEFCAQAFIFFAAGFESSASTIALTIHELAIHPDIQEKLYQEIKAFKEANGDITSENLSSLKYLDCVLNESLRKWSPAIIIDRICVKTYELPPSSKGGKPCILNPGDGVYNSCNSLHLDPQYWPDPHKYDPERWSDENKHKIQPFTYQPFGLGPRNCLGSRFAILEAKVLLFYLMLKFKILKCPKTSEPIELTHYGFHMKNLTGTYTKFEERN